MSLTDQIMFDHVQPVVFIDMLLYRLGFFSKNLFIFSKNLFPWNLFIYPSYS